MATSKSVKYKTTSTAKVKNSETSITEISESVKVEKSESEKIEKSNLEEIENDKKLKYEKYRKDNFTAFDREITSAVNTFNLMKSDELVKLALNYDIAPFSTTPEVADALKFELIKRKMDSVALALVGKLSKSEWYTKPWIKF